MSYHIISIDAPVCDITCSRGQLIVSSADGNRQVPMEDVASIVITSFKCTISSSFLVEAAKCKVSVIICETYKPISILLPADRATDTALLRNLASLPSQLKKRLWQKTVDAKCDNQLHIASAWSPQHDLLSSLRDAVSTRRDSKEAESARAYWRIFSNLYTNNEFSRGRDSGGFNSLFNYSYAILLSCVLRYLLAVGLDPTFGIFHKPRAHAAPLAYDLMEPFRPAFDDCVVNWINLRRIEGMSPEAIADISPDFRKHVLSVLLRPVSYNNSSLPLKNVIELVVRSFRAAVSSLQSGPYEPWKI